VKRVVKRAYSRPAAEIKCRVDRASTRRIPAGGRVGQPVDFLREENHANPTPPRSRGVHW
jgi:hypothetical protein